MTSLQDLVDQGDLDGLLAHVTLDDVADAWWRHNVKEFDDDAAALADADWWAVEAWIDHLFDRDEELCRRAIRALAEQAPPGADLGYLGAGPLEEFVSADEDRVWWIEAEAERSPNFRKALANVWIDDLPPELFLRIERAAGTELARPSARPPRPRPDQG